MLRRRRKSKQETTRRPRRPWPVTAAGLLILVEGLGLAFLAQYNFPRGLNLLIGPANPLYHVLYELIPTLLYALLSAVALLLTVDFLRVRPNAWLIAIILQGLVLLSALVQYFGSRPPYVYVQMLYGIFMVIYLYHQAVRDPFERAPLSAEAFGER